MRKNQQTLWWKLSKDDAEEKVFTCVHINKYNHPRFNLITFYFRWISSSNGLLMKDDHCNSVYIVNRQCKVLGIYDLLHLPNSETRPNIDQRSSQITLLMEFHYRYLGISNKIKMVIALYDEDVFNCRKHVHRRVFTALLVPETDQNSFNNTWHESTKAASLLFLFTKQWPQ